MIKVIYQFLSNVLYEFLILINGRGIFNLADSYIYINVAEIIFMSKVRGAEWY